MTFPSEMPATVPQPISLRSALARAAAPWLAVSIGWLWLERGWLALALYHLQILLWLALDHRQRHRSARAIPTVTNAKSAPTSPQRLALRHALLLALPSALAGPALWFLLPQVSQIGLESWLQRFDLEGIWLLLMIPWFGLLHPALEELHWDRLRPLGLWSHFAFAGYHGLVLASLLKPLWLTLTVLGLVAISIFWQQLTQRSGSRLPAILSHTLADLGFIVVAWLWVQVR